MIRSVLIFLFIGSWLFAQERLYQVLSPDKNQLAFVIILNKASDAWVVSDETGIFQIPKPGRQGDTLQFRRYGFQSVEMTVEDVMNLPVIILHPDPLRLDPVNIVGQQGGRSTFSQNPVYLPEIDQSGSSSLRRYFSMTPGISVRTYGGPGSISMLSMDGGSATNTKVLIDGFDLTNAQNGELDISQFPIPFIQNAKIENAGNSLLGSGSSDGTITLYPWWNSTGVSFSAGSYGHSSASGTLLLQRKQHSLRFLAGKRYDRGDFPVAWKERSFQRENNDFNQVFGGLQIRRLFSPGVYLKILALITDQKRGVPGTVWAPSAARRNDRLIFGGSAFGWITDRGNSQLKLLWKQSDETFTDGWFGIHSDHKVRSVSGIYNAEKEIRRHQTLILKTSIHEDALISTDAGERVRRVASQGLVYRFQLFQNWAGQLSGRTDLEKHVKPVVTYGGSARMNIYSRWIESITITAETGYRRPSFNELYWKPGGNPNLKPEQSMNTSISLISEVIPHSRLRFNMFYHDSRNLIQWLAYISYWRPVNIARSARKGFRVMYEWSLSELGMNGNISCNRLKTINLQDGINEGKRLRYAPENTFSARLNWNFNKWTLTGDFHHTGKLLSVYDWPEDLYLPPVSILNSSVSYSFIHETRQIQLILSVDNMTNNVYQSMLGYPEMGRNYRITLKLEKQ